MRETGKQAIPKCYICDGCIEDNKGYSLFNTYVPTGGNGSAKSLLASFVQKVLCTGKLYSDSVRSCSLCEQCYESLESVHDLEGKILSIKVKLFNWYKSTCEKYGADYSVCVEGVATQTENVDSNNIQILNVRSVAPNDSLTEDALSDDDNKEAFLEADDTPFEVEETTTTETKKPTVKEDRSEEITIEADPPFDRDDDWRRRPVSCKICGKWFKETSTLQEHIKQHMEEKQDEKIEKVAVSKAPNICSICNKKFKSSNELKAHELTHRPVIPFTCKHCGKQMKSRGGAFYHVLKIHKINLSQQKKLAKHLLIDAPAKIEENIKQEKPSGKTEEESDTYSSDGSDHGDQENTNEQEEDAVVVDDEKCSSSEDELPLARRRKEFIFAKIKQEVTVDNKPAKQAPAKQQKTIQKMALQTLKKSCEISVTKVPKTPSSKKGGESVKPIKIKVEKLEDDDAIKLVVEKIDNEEIISKIKDLSKTKAVTIESKNKATRAKQASLARSRVKRYSLTTLLKMKKQKDAGLLYPLPREPKFECDICHKMWKTRGELNAHKITHSDARPFICEICGQAYKHKPALDVHVGMHKGIYQHQCPYCQKAFTQKGALQRHLPIHTGDLPYQCELCGKRFVHRTSFSIHTMAHTGVRNIRCKVCNLGVLSKSHLRRHMRIHTGEKPYECSTCGKAFAERYNLVAHQRIHDPNLIGPARSKRTKVQTCRLCNTTFDRRHKLEDHMVTAHNKVVDDSSVGNRSIFESDSYTSGNGVYRQDNRKVSDLVIDMGRSREEDEKSDMGSEPNPNDLSIRNIQSLRNWEIIRNFETSRNFELIRMSNGVEEGLRIPGAGSATPWSYVNPGS